MPLHATCTDWQLLRHFRRCGADAHRPLQHWRLPCSLLELASCGVWRSSGSCGHVATAHESSLLGNTGCPHHGISTVVHPPTEASVGAAQPPRDTLMALMERWRPGTKLNLLVVGVPYIATVGATVTASHWEASMRVVTVLLVVQVASPWVSKLRIPIRSVWC